MKKKTRTYLILAILCSVISSILWVYFAVMMGKMIEMAQLQDIHSLIAYIGQMIIVLVLCRMLSLLGQMENNQYGIQESAFWKERYVHAVLLENNIADPTNIISKLSYDFEKIRLAYLQNKSVFLSDLISFTLSSYFVF